MTSAIKHQVVLKLDTHAKTHQEQVDVFIDRPDTAIPLFHLDPGSMSTSLRSWAEGCGRNSQIPCRRYATFKNPFRKGVECEGTRISQPCCARQVGYEEGRRLQQHLHATRWAHEVLWGDFVIILIVLGRTEPHALVMVPLLALVAGHHGPVSIVRLPT